MELLWDQVLECVKHIDQAWKKDGIVGHGPLAGLVSVRSSPRTKGRTSFLQHYPAASLLAGTV